MGCWMSKGKSSSVQTTTVSSSGAVQGRRNSTPLQNAEVSRSAQDSPTPVHRNSADRPADAMPTPRPRQPVGGVNDALPQGPRERKPPSGNCWLALVAAFGIPYMFIAGYRYRVWAFFKLICDPVFMSLVTFMNGDDRKFPSILESIHNAVRDIDNDETRWMMIKSVVSQWESLCQKSYAAEKALQRLKELERGILPLEVRRSLSARARRGWIDCSAVAVAFDIASFISGHRYGVWVWFKLIRDPEFKSLVSLIDECPEKRAAIMRNLVCAVRGIDNDDTRWRMIKSVVCQWESLYQKLHAVKETQERLRELGRGVLPPELPRCDEKDHNYRGHRQDHNQDEYKDVAEVLEYNNYLGLEESSKDFFKKLKRKRMNEEDQEV